MIYKTVKLHNVDGSFLAEVQIVHILPEPQVILYNSRVFLKDTSGEYKETYAWTNASDIPDPNSDDYYQPWGV